MMDHDDTSCLPPHSKETSWTRAASMLEICVTAGDGSPSTTKPAGGLHSSSTILMKKVGAEFVGTFLMIFAAEGSAIMNEKTKGGLTIIGVGLGAGLAVMIVIISIGHISGAHLNPAATLCFAVIKEFSWLEVPFYVVTQLVASVSASLFLKVILEYEGEAGLTLPSGTTLETFLVEFIITFGLMFIATAVSTDTGAVGELAGLAIGATVVLNNLVAGYFLGIIKKAYKMWVFNSPLTGASMNPVRTLGPAIVFNNYTGTWVYIFGPTLGALTGTITYTLIRLNPIDESKHTQISTLRKTLSDSHPSTSQ